MLRKDSIVIIRRNSGSHRGLYYFHSHSAVNHKIFKETGQFSSIEISHVLINLYDLKSHCSSILENIVFSNDINL